MSLLTERADVLGCSIDRVDMSEAAERCDRFVRTRAGAQHMAVNAAKIVAMRHDHTLHQLVDRCELITADGQAVVWASRLLGDPLPTRVAGIDLMLALLALAEDRGYRVYVLGAQRDVLELAIAHLRELHPRLAFAGYRDGYFSDAQEPSVVAEIRAARPDLLFVAMSTPRKEYFLGRWGSELDVPFSMGVGGAIDVVAGVTKRAPRSLQRLGLEWAFRLAQEPRRLFRRYLVTNSEFVALTLRGMAELKARRAARARWPGRHRRPPAPRS
jgi:N-acetylglucosaminyldiphosphoundecaprenol N-acetyl-beta-D-mannosaminyltransferase